MGLRYSGRTVVGGPARQPEGKERNARGDESGKREEKDAWWAEDDIYKRFRMCLFCVWDLNNFPLNLFATPNTPMFL